MIAAAPLGPFGDDLSSPDTFAHGVPHETFRRLRATAPVAWHPDRVLPDIELDGPVERLRSDFLSGIKHMPVRFSPA